MEKWLSIGNLQPKDVEIKFKSEIITFDNEIEIDICVLNVNGNYPRGSKGAETGEYLRGISVFLREFFLTDALIIDFSSLNYSWGNNLSGVVKPEMLETSAFAQGSWLGYYVISSKQNKKPLEDLFLKFSPSLDTKIYSSIDEAYDDIKKKVKKIYYD